MKITGFHVNCPGHDESNEQLISAALETAALGAKLEGAGEGGTIVVLFPGEDSADLEEVLQTAGASAIFRSGIAAGATLN